MPFVIFKEVDCFIYCLHFHASESRVHSCMRLILPEYISGEQDLFTQIYQSISDPGQIVNDPNYYYQIFILFS